MRAADTQASHPGLRVGPTSEFSLFHVRQDHPDAGEVLQHAAMKPLLDEAAD